MWNYSYAISSLLVLVVFMGYYFALPRIPIRLNLTYIKLVAVECLVMTMDIVSTWGDMNYEIVPRWLLYLLNDAYFVVFFMRAYVFFLFTANVLKSSFSYDTVKKTVIQIPFVALTLIVISSPLTHLFYYIDGNGYHSGILYNLLYFLFWFYLISSYYLIFRHKLRIRRKRELNSVLWYNTILLLGIICRYAFPRYLLMDTFCLMALIVIYLSFENPDFFLEGRTWVFNSRALREYVEEINGRKQFTVLEFVIHNYRDFRELYGVRQMDQGVCLIGNYLRKAFPEQKVFYYRSGRFILLGEKNSDYKKTYEKIREKFKNPWQADDAELFLDIGAAVLRFGERTIPFESVMSILVDGFEIADKAIDDEIILIDEKAQKKTTMQAEIKRALKYAIEHDQVKAFLQPIVNSKTGSIEGAEVLSRIVDKDGKVIPPGSFIPIAEKNGMINQLGDQLFVKTCKFLKENDVKALGLSFVNINLSPIQFMRQDIAQRLYSYTKEYGIDPSFIHLEITEEVMIEDALLFKQMQALISKGFKFVLDDYGKGYSNAARLKKCPYINIKLDMSIVWDYCKNPDEMLPSMVSTFKKMGFGITAEGIEDEEMEKRMACLGVDYLQGYHFSKPIPMSEFVKRYKQAI